MSTKPKVTPLSKLAKQQIQLDLEAHSSFKPGQIVALREGLYGGKYKRAAQNRINYLIGLKKTNPVKYFQALAAAQVFCATATNIGNQEDLPSDDESTLATVKGDGLLLASDSEDDDLLEPVDQTYRTRSASKTKETPKKKPAKTKETPKSKGKKAEKLTSPPFSSININTPSKSRTTAPKVLFSPLSSPISTMSTVATHDGPLQSNLIRFATIEEASEFADDVINVEFDLPEDNAHGLFIQKVDDVRVSPTELITKLKVLVPTFIDLRDFSNTSCFIVCGGSGLMITLPTLPHYILHEHGDLLGQEKVKCQRTIDKTAEMMTSIIGDRTRSQKKLLLLMPEGLGLSADFTENIRRTDVKVHGKLREKTSVYNVANRSIKQLFYSLYWQLRIVNESRQLMAQIDDDQMGIESAFEGMNLLAGSASMEIETTSRHQQQAPPRLADQPAQAPPRLAQASHSFFATTTMSSNNQQTRRPAGPVSHSFMSAARPSTISASSFPTAPTHPVQERPSPPVDVSSFPTAPTHPVQHPSPAPTHPVQQPSPAAGVASSFPTAPTHSVEPIPASVPSAPTHPVQPSAGPKMAPLPKPVLDKSSQVAHRGGGRLANARELRNNRIDTASRHRQQKRLQKIARVRAENSAKEMRQQLNNAPTELQQTTSQQTAMADASDQKMDADIEELELDIENAQAEYNTLQQELHNNNQEENMGGLFEEGKKGGDAFDY
ncbi:unknown protein [Seminavis robusta]|uniref:Uncharacterized protein n=1 Tax=Seminavis robusta TaxID=568900 RepID=A0A9N8E3F1_9STRA|nr:unknown protein [Seminavis robusta]|eukprot:Sro514_g158130.1 n/a (721) ;mRNA; r:47253-49503